MNRPTTSASAVTAADLRRMAHERLERAKRDEADEGYSAFERLIAERIAAAKGVPLFTTKAEPDALWLMYLSWLPAGRRQHYRCHCCRRFFEKYAGLVCVDDMGRQTAAIWRPVLFADDSPRFFHDALVQLTSVVETAAVTGVFLSSDEVWGEPVSKAGWTHLSGRNPNVYRPKLATAEQKMAVLKEDYGILCHSLADYPAAVAEQAVRVLQSDALTRSEKAVGVAEWFLKLHQQIDGVKGRRRDNLIWLAVATAPAGYAHVRSTVISTLLDDLKAGLAFETVRRKWTEKLNPLQYQRPTAAPKAGQIDQAEKLVAELGLAPAFRRRFATLDDVQVKVWEPHPDEPKAAAGGVFAHLRTPPSSPLRAVELPETAITWTKFERTVLPDAVKVEVQTPYGVGGPFYGLLTAADPLAPPLFQWDTAFDGYRRNPVSWYFSRPLPTPRDVRLPAGQYVDASAVFYPPHQWWHPEMFTHFDKMVFFSLVGCGPPKASSLCLFPECLRGELHGIRAVIESHSNRGNIEGWLTDHGDAHGLAFQASNATPLVVRVTTRGGPAVYKIDRWD